MSVDDPSGGRASYWLDCASSALDCAVQCCGDPEVSLEIDLMESRCGEIAEVLKKEGN